MRSAMLPRAATSRVFVGVTAFLHHIFLGVSTVAARHRVAFFTGALLLPHPVFAAPVLLGPGDTVTATFRFTAPFAGVPGLPPVLIEPGISSAFEGGAQKIELFDGNQLLGVRADSRPYALLFSFFHDENAVVPPNLIAQSTPINFTSVGDRTINGRFKITIENGNIQLDPTLLGDTGYSKPAAAFAIVLGCDAVGCGVIGFANISSVQINAPPSPTGPTNYGLFIGAKDVGRSALTGTTIRFDQNAQRIASAFGSRPNARTTVITGDLTPDANGNPISPITVKQVADALADIRARMHPGDTLTMYINNHGGAFTRNPDGTHTVNDTGVGDDVIYIGEYLTDNALANMLKMFDGFRKTIFLDACHGGGFWGGTDVTEFGPLGLGFNDLNALSNIALYAAAPEYGLEYSVGSGLSFWGEALEDALKLNLTGTELGVFLYVDSKLRSGLRDSPVWYELGFGDAVAADASLIQTFDAHSADFEMADTIFGGQPGTPPVTTVTVSPNANSAGWNNTNVTVNLSATDESGAAATQVSYVMSGAQSGSAIIGGNSASIAITAEGTSTLTYFAVDDSGDVETPKTITVRIDKTPPTIAGMPVNCSLWPPNHEMVQVATVSVSDGLSGPASFGMSASSDEPANVGEADIAIGGAGLAPHTIALRADRLGTGTGRVYMLIALARDAADNTASVTATCLVPHDKGK